MTTAYKIRQELRPRALTGISEDQIAQHWALYEGYVKNVNLLNQKIKTLSTNDYYGAEFAELKRRQGFEYNGMVLHEHYFGILKADRPALKSRSGFSARIGECFGSFEAWKKQFVAMGQMRGVGWVILYFDPLRDVLANFWIKSHEDGHPAGFKPVLVMDLWEHAYMVDWGASGRGDYIEKFFQNVDWTAVEGKFLEAAFGGTTAWAEANGVERRLGIPNRRSVKRGEQTA